MKKFIVEILVLTMVLSLFAGFSTYAANDISGHWGEEVISKWNEEEKIKGYDDGSFKPNNNIQSATFGPTPGKFSRIPLILFVSSICAICFKSTSPFFIF